MAIDLHHDCRKRVIEALECGLRQLTITNGIFIDRGSLRHLSAAERALPQTGQLREVLVNYIDEMPLTEFVYGQLSHELLTAGRYAEGSTALAEAEPYADIRATAERLVSQLASSPRSYTFTIDLPGEISTFLQGITQPVALSTSVRLVPTCFLNQHFPPAAPHEALNRHIYGAGLLSNVPSEWSGTHMQVSEEGFVGTYTHTSPVTRVEDAMKAFFGLGLALRVFKRRLSYSLVSPQRKLIVHARGESHTWEVYDTAWLDRDASKLIEDLTLEDVDNSIPDLPDRQKWMARNLMNFRAAYATGEQGAQILRGAQWLFDSYAAGNELLAFVQAMISLEIMLGDRATSDLMGLSELLRNRCAYLVGNNREQREEILYEFREIYEVRSAIVHRGKNRLRWKDRQLFHRLRWLCGRVIQEELRLVQKDSANPWLSLTSESKN